MEEINTNRDDIYENNKQKITIKGHSDICSFYQKIG